MDKLLTLLGNNNLEDAFTALKEIYSKNPNSYQDSITLINRYNKLRKDSIRGLLSYTEESLIENKLVFDTIRYLKSINSNISENTEPNLEIIYECITDNPLRDAYQEMNSLKLEHPKSKYLTLGYAALDIRKGLSKLSKAKVDERFMELHEILKENEPDNYKTVFCFLLIYKIEFYDIWEILPPVDFSFKYNRYVGDSVLKRDFLLKMKLSSKSKTEIRLVYKKF